MWQSISVSQCRIVILYLILYRVHHFPELPYPAVTSNVVSSTKFAK